MMHLNFVDLKAMKNESKSSPMLEQGDVLFSLQPSPSGQLSLDAGLPVHRYYSLPHGVVSFGLPRLQRQEERNGANSVASQVYNFVRQHPNFEVNHIYRPIYDLGPDDALGIALLAPESREILMSDHTKLLALLSELNEYAANKYNFVKQSEPQLLNQFLNEFPFPFKEVKPGSSKVEACFVYMESMISLFIDNWEELAPCERVFPSDIQFSINPEFKTDLSVMLLVEDTRYGADYLAAQMYFKFNPTCARVVTARHMRNSVKHAIIVHNANMADANLVSYPYPAVKELNNEERHAGGDPNWKNLKINVVGPNHGSDLSLAAIWEKCKL